MLILAQLPAEFRFGKMLDQNGHSGSTNGLTV
jgi:hypothetical protein